MSIFLVSFLFCSPFSILLSLLGSRGRRRNKERDGKGEGEANICNLWTRNIRTKGISVVRGDVRNLRGE